ncbi:MAG: type II toxin-antitoxin system RelE/ParE family toxin [Nitrososphaerota archaeon]|jgi:mRNA interferase RelE/StbE|nr:type II toxin-antitoxin system RelE/ParE family toxin [Nitrososphaerota archaeon]
MKKNSKIILSKAVIKQFDCLDKHVRVRIFRELQILESNPLAGKLLTGDFQGFRSLRIGKYRVIYQLLEHGLKNMLIEHRKKVYDTLTIFACVVYESAFWGLERKICGHHHSGSQQVC